MTSIKIIEKLVKAGCIFISIIILSSCSGHKKDGEIKIGLAEVSYRPDIGLNLVGNYRGDDYASRGIHDSLYAKALVAEDRRGQKVAVLSIDICMIPKESINFIREFIAAGSDIKAENIMIMATHTHSGPDPDVNNQKAREFLSRAAEAVIIANQKLMPARIFAGRSQESRISHNRRLRAKDGTTHMCWEKLEPGYIVGQWGSIDPEVIALTIEQEGRETGVLVNFGCHPTTLTGNNWLYSADYPGYLAESIKRVKGKDFVSMFCNGCCGNVTQVDYRIGFPDTYQECQRIGYILGVSAMEAMQNSTLLEGDIVAASREMVPLDRIDISEERLAWARKIMKVVEKEGMPPIQADGMPDAYYAKSWLEMHEKQNIIDSAEVMVIRIGDLAFVGLPGEIFNEFGIEIKSKSPCRNTIVTGNTNDKRSYFPTAVSFTQGPEGFTPGITGYETTPGTTRYEIGSGEKLAESAINQLNRIF